MRTTIWLSGLVVLAISVVDARAQYPGGYPGGYSAGGYPGLYGGGLSPYLNLRSRNLGNAATNYYNFVRPYTGGTFGNAIMPQTIGAPVRQPFFSNLRSIYDEDLSSQTFEKDKEGVLRAEMPPAGHGAGFMNQMGYFGQTGGQAAAGAGRTGASGAGARRPR